MDGSALPFAEAITAAGTVSQDKLARFICPEKIEFAGGRSEYGVMPHEFGGMTLSVSTQFDNWPEGSAAQIENFTSNSAPDYAEKIAPARTFAFREEVDQLIAAGLAKGGSLDNALIITPPAEFSTPLRLPQEWAVHKMLDLIGDLALVDARIEAFIYAARPGHRGNVRLALELLKQQEPSTRSKSRKPHGSSA